VRFGRRTGGPENFQSPAKKDFFNTICQERTWAAAARDTFHQASRSGVSLRTMALRAIVQTNAKSYFLTAHGPPTWGFMARGG
jgi:hypothetical protein